MKYLLNIGSITLLFLATLSHAKPALVEGIVATVDKKIILFSELQERKEQTLQTLRRQRIDPNTISNLNERVLNGLIEEALVFNIADKQNIQISDIAINREITAIAQSNKMTVFELKNAVTAEGREWADYRENLRKSMLFNQIKQQFLSRKIQISEQDVKDFLGRERLLNDNSEYNIAQILIPTERSISQRARSLIEVKRIYEQLKSGAISFKEASAQYSKASNALEGGDLGWLDAGNLPDSFLIALQNIDGSQYTPPVLSNLGYHILYLKDKRLKQSTTLKRYKLQQIVLSQLTHSEDEALKILKEIAQSLEQSPEKFADLAKKYSDDANSVAQDGKTGWLVQGRFSFALEQQISTLSLNTLSPPIYTNNGWYLVKVLKAETFDATALVRKEKALEFLTNQQSQVQYKIFIDDLKEKAAILIEHSLLSQI